MENTKNTQNESISKGRIVSWQENGDEKANLIKVFAELLDKHCADKDDVWCILRSISEFSRFMSDQRFDHGTHLMSDYVSFKVIIDQKGLTNPYGILLTRLAETANCASVLAGRNAEALNILFKMEDDIDKILAL